MNKQIEELALRVAKEMPNGFLWSEGCDHESGIVEQEILEFSKAFLAELAKQSEPVAIVADAYEDYEIVCPIHPEFIGDPLPVGTLLFTRPLPQADLVAEIELVKSQHLETLMDVLDAKEEMLALGIQQNSFPEMFKELREQLSAAQAELDDREGMVCGDRNDTGWLENRVEGRHPCTYMTEAEPYQLLEQQLKAAQADNEQLVKALQSAKDSLMHHRLFGIDTLQAWKNSHTRIEGDIEEAIAAHKARQGKVASKYEARRWCSGDDAWTEWLPCSAEAAERYSKDDSMQVRQGKEQQ